MYKLAQHCSLPAGRSDDIRVTNDDIWHRANIFVNIFRGFVIYEPLEPLTSCSCVAVESNTPLSRVKTHDALFSRSVRASASCGWVKIDITATYLAAESSIKHL